MRTDKRAEDITKYTAEFAAHKKQEHVQQQARGATSADSTAAVPPNGQEKKGFTGVTI
jgi:hypothetical protein